MGLLVCILSLYIYNSRYAQFYSLFFLLYIFHPWLCDLDDSVIGRYSSKLPLPSALTPLIPVDFEKVYPYIFPLTNTHIFPLPFSHYFHLPFSVWCRMMTPTSTLMLSQPCQTYVQPTMRSPQQIACIPRVSINIRGNESLFAILLLLTLLDRDCWKDYPGHCNDYCFGNGPSLSGAVQGKYSLSSSQTRIVFFFSFFSSFFFLMRLAPIKLTGSL